MHLQELFEEVSNQYLEEGKTVAWGRSGNKVVRKFRCPFGRKKGKLVTDLSKCSKPLDFKKRLTLKKTKAAQGSRITRKAKRTKKYNPMAKRAASLNRKIKWIL